MKLLMEMKFAGAELEGHCPHCNNYHSISTKELIQNPLKCRRIHCDGCHTRLDPYIQNGLGELFVSLTKDLWLYTDKFSEEDIGTFLYMASTFTSKNSYRRILKERHRLLGDDAI